MRIAVAQITPTKGNVSLNKKKHLHFIHVASQYKAKALFFPELSITGYEPTLAKKLNFTLNDPLLLDFKSTAKKLRMLVGMGAPVHNNAALFIGQIMFRSDGSVNYYAKRYLHPDEIPFFHSGQVSPLVTVKDLKLGLAICYEISQDKHINDLFTQGVDIVVAPVAKSLAGITAAHKRLATIARKHSTPILMSNCVGPCDDFIAAGESAVWGHDGHLLQTLEDDEEGILILDTVSNSCQKIVI